MRPLFSLSHSLKSQVMSKWRYLFNSEGDWIFCSQRIHAWEKKERATGVVCVWVRYEEVGEMNGYVGIETGEESASESDAAEQLPSMKQTICFVCLLGRGHCCWWAWMGIKAEMQPFHWSNGIEKNCIRFCHFFTRQLGGNFQRIFALGKCNSMFLIWDNKNWKGVFRRQKLKYS